jgi:type I restriction enzyme S subunit
MMKARAVRTILLEDALEALIDYRGKTPEKSDSGVLLVTAKVIKDGFVERDVNEYIEEDQYDVWMRRGLPHVGDVLVTTEAPLGQVARLDDAYVALAQRVILLRANPRILIPSYLYYLMQGPAVQDELHKRATGTTVAGIKQSELRKVPLQIPEHSEQWRVCFFLDAICRLIENNLRRIRVLEEVVSKTWTSLEGLAARKQPLKHVATLARDAVTPSPGLSYQLYSFEAYDNGQASCLIDGAEVKSSKFLMLQPCVLFAKLNPHIPRVWLVRELADEASSVASTEFLVLEPKAGFPVELLFAAVRSDTFRRPLVVRSRAKLNCPFHVASSRGLMT